jgi:hypothetical protein
MTDTIEQPSVDSDATQEEEVVPVVGHPCRRCAEVKTGAPSCN